MIQKIIRFIIIMLPTLTLAIGMDCAVEDENTVCLGFGEINPASGEITINY